MSEQIEYPLLKAFCAVAQKRGARQQYSWLLATLTDKEALNLERRLEVARLLRAGASYSEIQKQLQVSAATVAQVSQQLNEMPEFAELVNFLDREQLRWWKRLGSNPQKKD